MTKIRSCSLIYKIQLRISYGIVLRTFFNAVRKHVVRILYSKYNLGTLLVNYLEGDRTKKDIKLIIGLALFLLVVVFTVQNPVAVEVKILFWYLSVSRSLVLFFVLVIGVIIGWFTSKQWSQLEKRARSVVERYPSDVG